MRLFVAIALSETVRDALGNVQRSLTPCCEGVRWVAPERLHLTLKFLGETRDEDVASTAEFLATAVQKFEPFEFEVGGCGCFPKGDAVRIVWGGVTEASGILTRLVDEIEGTLETLGFPREQRPFSPHLTLGRVREDRSGGRVRNSVASQSLGPLVQRVLDVVLMQSVLSPKGPTYTIVSRAALGS